MIETGSLRPCLAIGGVNMDFLGLVARFPQHDEEVGLAGFSTAPGGHAGNFAVALARMGLPVRLLAAVGTDPLGDLAIAALNAAGVETVFIERRSGAGTGVVFIPVLPGGDKALYIARGANEHLSLDELAAAAGDCTLAMIFDPPLALLPALAAHLASRFVVYAPGGLAADAPLEALRPMLQVARLLIVNAPESRALTGCRVSREAAVRLRERWELAAVVTSGREGCWLADADGVVHQPSFPVSTVDTTGAGDAFAAGVTAMLLQGRTLREAVRIGCAVGALATRALGAQASLPYPDEVSNLIESAGTTSAGAGSAGEE
jgi:ribokinase